MPGRGIGSDGISGTAKDVPHVAERQSSKSGGVPVQSARLVKHRRTNPSTETMAYRQKRRAETVLNPGRYVGVGERPPDDFDFAEKLEELNEELETLNAEAREPEERIAENVVKLLEENSP